MWIWDTPLKRSAACYRASSSEANYPASRAPRSGPDQVHAERPRGARREGLRASSREVEGSQCHQAVSSRAGAPRRLQRRAGGGGAGGDVRPFKTPTPAGPEERGRGGEGGGAA